MKLLGIDYGTRRVGLAVGDTESRLAVPFEVFNVGSNFWEQLTALVKKETIDEMVVGMPLSLRDGGEGGEMVAAARSFIADLRVRIPLPIHEVDERFSTDMAGRLLDIRKKDLDAVAAAVILQSYLDRVSL